MRCSDNDDYFNMIKFVVDVYIRPVSSVNDVRMVQIWWRKMLAFIGHSNTIKTFIFKAKINRTTLETYIKCTHTLTNFDWFIKFHITSIGMKSSVCVYVYPKTDSTFVYQSVCCTHTSKTTTTHFNSFGVLFNSIIQSSLWLKMNPN